MSGSQRKLEQPPTLADQTSALEREVVKLRQQLAVVSSLKGSGTVALAEREPPSQGLPFSEAIYHALLELSPQAVFMNDAGGNTTYTNHYWFEYSGLTSEQSLGKGWQVAVHPDDQEALAQRITNSVRSGEAYEHEARFRRRDGQFRWHMVRAIPLRDAQNEITGWMGTAVDIHDRKMAGAAVAVAEETLRTVMSSAGLGSCSYFPETGKMDWNARTYEILHLPPETEATLEMLLAAAHPDDRARIQEVVGGLLMGGVDGDYDIEHRVVWPDGTVRWVLCRGRCQFPANGRARLTGVVLDITDMKDTERERAMLTAAIQQSPDFIGITNRKGNILFLNQAGQKMVGLRDEAEARSKTVFDFLFPEELEILEKQIQPAVRAGQVWEGQFRLRHFGTGEPVVLETRGFGIFDSTGRLINIATVSRDVAEKKRLEEQLHLAQRMEAVGQLAGGIAHDFNNLMTIIRGASEVLADSSQPSGSHEKVVREIREASDRASALTEKLLAYGRRQMVRPQVLNLNDVISRTHDMLRRLVSEDIRIDLKLSPGLWNVRMDPVQFDQVLLNLASNARDAMPHGGSITITTRNHELVQAPPEQPSLAPGAYVSLSFADNGCGMDSTTLRHVFEPFFTTKKPGKGTGMGLASVYGIVQQSGGHVSVSSSPGSGTLFHFLLPRTQEEVPAEARDQQTSSGRGKETILLVEDEPSLRDLLADYVRERGYTVFAASSAEEALQVAKSQALDMLITDIVMPGESGPELAATVSAMQPAIATIFISGYAEHAALEDALRQPHVVFMQKPFRFGELVRTIRQVLDERNAKSVAS